VADPLCVAVGGHVLAAGPPAPLCDLAAALARTGRPLVWVHGNGPQVGLEAAWDPRARAGPAGLDAAVARTQGELGYRLQHAFAGALRQVGCARPVVAVVTRVVVAPDDPAWQMPGKPVGPPLDAAAVARDRALGVPVMQDPPRGWRRAAPSPRPQSVCEAAVIRDLVVRGVIVIAGGGGGIPVFGADGGPAADAVVDKDWTATLLALAVGAPEILNVTAVPAVVAGFGGPDARPLARVGPAEAARLLAAGTFGAGSMQPKIEAALAFLAAGGQRVVIADVAGAGAALAGAGGTRLERAPEAA
jgi:carbamate kinase